MAAAQGTARYTQRRGGLAGVVRCVTAMPFVETGKPAVGDSACRGWAESSTETGAMKRYPCLGSVSMNVGFRAESPRAKRNLFSAALRLPSNSTYVSDGQSACRNSSRVTGSPGFSSSMHRTRKGWSCRRTGTPRRRSSLLPRSTSNTPNR